MIVRKREFSHLSEVVMERTSLLALPEGMQIEQIQITENGLVIQIAATTPTSCCPLCAEISSSIHCHYQRTLPDAPCAGRRVQLLLGKDFPFAVRIPASELAHDEQELDPAACAGGIT